MARRYTVLNNRATFTDSGRSHSGLGLILLIIAIAILFVAQAIFAQNIANYGPVVRNTSVTYTSIASTGSSFAAWQNGTNTDDNRTYPTSIGFTFYYMGQTCTTFSIGTNGLLDVANVTPMNFLSGAYSSDNTTFSSYTTPTLTAVAPLYDDLWLTGNPGTQAALDASFKYQLTGSSPNRVLTVEWINLQAFGSSTGALNFQVKLYEGSNKIEILYGTMTAGSVALTYTVGINGLSMSNPPQGSELLTLQNTTTWAFDYIAMNTLATMPSAGDQFIFTPLYTTSPSAPTTLSFSNIGQTALQVNWVDNSSTETGFFVYRSTDNLNFTRAGVVLSTTRTTTSTGYSYYATGLSPSTTYFFRVSAANEGSAESAYLTGSQATNSSCSMSGTYSVGPGGAYASLTSAFAALTGSGLGGPVILELKSSYVSTVETFPLTLGQFPCASASNTVTVRPELGATGLEILNSAGTPLTLDMNGVDYLIFDGRPGGAGTSRELTIHNNSTAGIAVRFINDATNNTIRYCKIRGANTSTAFGVVVFSTTTGSTGNDNNTIDWCDIYDSPAGTPAVGIYASGTTAIIPQYNSGNTISNCNVYNFFQPTGGSFGMEIGTGNTNWTITGNKLYQEASRTYTAANTHYGIFVGPGANGSGFTVNNNKIGNNSSYMPTVGPIKCTMSGAGAAYQALSYVGIYLSVGSGATTTLQADTVRDFDFTTGQTAVTAFIGIMVATQGNVDVGTTQPCIIGSDAPGSTGSITLTYGNATANAAGGGVIGIYNTSTGTVNIGNNKIASILARPDPAIVSYSSTVQFHGIYSTTGIVTISGNMIGEPSTANSIQCAAGTYAGAQPLRGIYVTGATSCAITNNIVQNCTNAYTSTSTGGQVAGIFVSSGSGISIVGNTVRYLSCAANSTGSTTSAAVLGIAQGSTSGPAITVAQNVVHSLSNPNTTASGTYMYGLYFAGPTSYQNTIAKNFIHSLSLSSTTTTQYIYGMYIASGTEDVVNNMLRLGIDQTGTPVAGYNIYGIYDLNGSNCNWYHNTVYIGGPNASATYNNSYCFYRGSAGVDNVRNNIFDNNRGHNTTATGNHFAYYLSTITTITSDYNIYKASGKGHCLAYANAANRLTIQDLRTNLAGQDMHSASYLCGTGFVDSTGPAPTANLRLSGNTPAEGQGIAIPTVTDDIDGQTRSSFTPTDIGACAGNFTVVDVFTPMITYTALANTASLLSRTLSGVTITDQGALGVPTTPGPPDYRPRIWYRKSSGTATGWYSNAGTLSTGTGSNGQWNFVIDYSLIPSYTPAAGDVIQYYVVAQDQASPINIGYYPFNGTTPVHVDVNTQTTASGVPSSYTIVGTTPLSGTVTVGATGGTYASLTGVGGLFDAINLNGLSGNLTVQVVDNTTEDGTNALNQWTETGSGLYTLTIVSSTTTVRNITGTVSTANGMIRLNGADRVTFDGRVSGSGQYLLFRNSNITQPTFAFLNDALNNTLQNCVIEGANASTTGVVNFGAITTTGNNNNNITGCDLRDISVGGPAYPAYLIYSLGANQNVTVTGNTLHNYFNAASTSAGIYLSGGIGWTISNNKFYQDASRQFTTTTVSHYGIYIASGGNGFTVVGNTIGYATSGGTGTYMLTTSATTYTPIMYGIYLSVGTTTATSVQQNTIAAITLTSANTTGAFYGIYVSSGLVTIGNLSGNTVGNPSVAGSITLNSNAATGPATLFGIYNSGGTSATISNNTVCSMTTTPVTPTTHVGSIVGIYSAGAGSIISGNTVGHSTTAANGLNAGTTSSTSYQYIRGIQTGATTTVMNNLVANLSSGHSGTSTTSAVVGFYNSTSAQTFTGNTVRNLTNACASPGTAGSSSVIGAYIGNATTGNNVSGNIIHSLVNTNASAAVSIIGLYFNGSTSTPYGVIAKNAVHSFGLSSTSTSAALAGVYIVAGTSYFQNNMIRLGIDANGNALTTSYAIYGVWKATASVNYLYNNSVYIGGTGVGAGATATYGFYRFSVGSDIIQNNIFSNERGNGAGTGKHYAIYHGGTTISSSDYNLLRASGTGGVLAYITADRATLQVYRDNFSGQELHSGVGNPNFIAPLGTSGTVDLRVNSPTPIEGAGLVIANVTDDFDSQGRSGLTPADIGANAGNFATTGTDVYTPYISYTALGGTTSTGSRTLSNVTITDVSTGVPTTAGPPDLRPRIWYRKSSGTATGWASNPGTLSSGTGTNGVWSFVIDYSLISGYTPAAGDVIQYYLVAQDAAGTPNIWYNPFTGALHADVNTQTTAPTTPNSYTIQPSIITVGTGGTFTSLTGAGGFFAWVNSTTLSENINVQIISDLTEDGTNALNQWAEAGVGGYTITIQPDASPRVISNGTITNDMIRLNGADRVTFNGGASKNLTIRCTNASYAALLFTNDACSNTIQNCNIEGQSTTTKGTITFTTANGTTLQGNDQNTITQCNVRNVSLANPLYAIYSVGTATPYAAMNSNNTISNNNIYDFFNAASASYGLYLAAGNTDWTISNNNIYQDATLTFTAGISHYGIYISNTTGNNFGITNNIIGYGSSTQTGKTTTTSTSTPVVYGMYLNVGTLTATSVQGNTIAGYDVTSAATTTPWYGVYVAGGNVNIGTVTPNTIGDNATGSININANADAGTTYGMYLSTTGNATVSNNIVGSISVNGSASLSAKVVGIQLAGSGVYTVSGNTVGNATTTNSINATAAVASGTTMPSVIGINSAASANTTISGNLVANLNNNYAGAVAGASLIGIQTTGGLNQVTGNIVRTLTTAAPTTGSDLSASLIGICQTSASAPQQVSQNAVHSLTNTAATGGPLVIGIHYAGPTSGSSNTLARNFVHSLSLATTGAGSMTGINITAGAMTVENNMVRLGIDASGASISSPYGINGMIHGAGTSPINFWHNSVYIGGGGVLSGGGNTYAFRRLTTGSDDIRNNIFVNDRSNATTGGTHFASVLNGTASVTSDYNIYRATGTGGVLASVNAGSTSLTSLQALRETFPGADLNSGTGDPNFVVPTGTSAAVDLHVSSPTPVEGAGVALTTTIDYDGAARSGLTPVDIGADAGAFTTSAGTDIFSPTIVYTPLANTGSTASRTLSPVTITDVGQGVPLSGATAPRVWYRKNAGTWVSSGGTSTGGTVNNSTWTFTIDYSVPGFGGTPSSGDVISYYVVAQDQATTPNVWYNPFIGASHSNVNTQTSAPSTPNSYTVGGTFSGTINVGTGQVYTSLTNPGGLFEAINSGSLSGNVTAAIVSDITETGTNALNQWTESGSGGYTLTIGPDGTTERVLSGNVNIIGGMIRLNGADRVSFDGRFGGSGKYLRFRNQSIYQPTFYLLNDAVNNTIRNCTVEGGDTSNVHGVIMLGQGTVTGNDYNTITYCDIRDVSTMAALPRNLIYSRGNQASYAQFNSNNTFSNNNLYNNYIDGQTAICIKSDTASTECTISGNSCYQTATRTSVSLAQTRWQGVYTFEALGGNILIQNNFFGGTAPNAGGGPMTFTTTNGTFNQIIPINIGAGSSTLETSIQGNIIRNMSITFATQSAVVMFAGIYSAGSTALVNIGNVTGNWVGDTTGTGSIYLNISGSVGPTLGMIMHQTSAGTCQNNKVGSITVDGTNTATVVLYGIRAVIQTTPFTLSGNFVGSFNTANSFQIPVSAAAMPVTFAGISSVQSAGGSCTLSNNIVTNLASNSTHPNTGLIGIQQMSGPAVVQGNTVMNLSSAAPMSSGGSVAGVGGFYLTFSSGPNTVSQNKVYNLWNTATAGLPGVIAQGMYLSLPSAMNTVVERNVIHSLSLATASPVAAIIGMWDAGGSGTFQNNVIRLGLDGNGNSITTENQIFGIYKTVAAVTNVYHNTVIVTGSNVGPNTAATAAVYRSGAGSPDDFRNNIFINMRSNASTTGGKHYAYYLVSTATLISDYNIYRVNTAGGGFIAYTGADRLTLQALRENLPGQDLYSGVGDPNFVNANGSFNLVDMHVQSNTPVESAGAPIAAVTDDMDGQARSGLTPTDIGADAGAFTTDATTDIFTPNIVFTPLGNTPNVANRTLAGVTITDVGTGVPTSGGTVPRVWYRNVTKASAWTSTAGTNTGPNQWSFTIDYSSAGGAPSWGDVIWYYIVAQDQATTPNVWYQPFIGALHGSVTSQTTAPTTPLSYQISGALFTGAYNVGAGQTYTSLTNPGGLFEAINSGALSGNVTANIVSNINELGTNALNQWGEIGAGGYTLTIQPDATTERLLFGDCAIANGLIRLNGADRVTIDGRSGGAGRYLRFRNLNTGYPVLTLINDASSNTIRNVYLESNSTATTGAVQFSTGITTGNDNNLFTQNVVRDRTDVTSTPLYYGLTSSGTSSVIANSENTISDNEFVNEYQYGIFDTTGTGNNWAITGNSFYYNHSTTPSVAISAIYFAAGTGSNGNIISGNFIGGQTVACGGGAWQNNLTGSYYGIYLRVGPSPATSVQNNTIQNINFYNYGAESFNGMYVISGACNIGNVTGNTIGHTSTANSINLLGTGAMRCIYYGSNEPGYISNNLIANLTLNTYTSGTNGLRGIDAYYSTTSPPILTINNNIIRNLTSTANSTSIANEAAVFGIYLGSTSSGLVVENNLITSLISTPYTLSANTAVIGINLNSGIGNVRKNTIYNLVNNSVGSAPVIVGIYTASGTWGVSNNMLTVGSGLSTNVLIDGIRDASAASSLYAYNSVLVTGSVTAGGSITHAFNRTSTAAFTLNNNIFFNDRSGGSGAHYAIGNTSATPATGWTSMTSNYNLFISPNVNYVGEWGTTVPVNRSFANWKTTAGSDFFSLADISSAVPSSTLFSNPGTDDLHIVAGNAEAWYVNGNGIATSSISDDFDNDSRSTTIAGGATDIGADEMTPTVGPNGFTMAPALGGTSTFSFAGRTLASINWGTGGSVPSNIIMTYYSGVNPPSPNSGNYSNAYWNFSASGGAAYSYTMTLNYTPAIMGTIPSEDRIRLAKRDVSWTHYPMSITNTTNKTVAQDALTFFSDFALSDNNNPLPVQLATFTARLNGTEVDLAWRTTSEYNTLRFAIERSTDREAWSEIGSVTAHGARDLSTDYRCVDSRLPQCDEVFYRLRIIDRDGSQKFSEVVRVALTVPTTVTLRQNYPNPFNAATQITYALPADAFVSLKIYDITGREVGTLVSEARTAGMHTVRFDAPDLPSGMYRCVLTAGDHNASIMMTVRK
jgi:hypothetical protein